MNTMTAVAVTIVALVIVGAIAIVVLRSSGEATVTAGKTSSTPVAGTAPKTSTETSPQGTGEHTYSPPAVTVTTPAAAETLLLSTGANMTIWDLYYNVERIIIAPYYDDYVGGLRDWPVLLNGTLYAISDIEVSYRITRSDGFDATMNMTWSLAPNQTFTAVCTDLEGNIISEETFHNVLSVSHDMTWTGGKRISYTAYLYNASALYWYHTMPPMDVPDYGAWKVGVLGGGVYSDTGSLTWSCAAAKAPMDPDLIMDCHPYIRESGDVWAVFDDEVFQQINEEATAFLLTYLNPPELFGKDFLQILPTATDTAHGWIPSGVPDYENIEYSIVYLGKIELPGEGVLVDAWRIDFQTSPSFLNGTYILTASTITPIWYRVSLVSNNVPMITIEYTLVNIHIMWDWSLPLANYSIPP